MRIYLRLYTMICKQIILWQINGEGCKISVWEVRDSIYYRRYSYTY